MAKTDISDRYRAPALDKGLDILELLAEQPSGMTRSEIVKAMGRSPSEVYRMIERLVARQYVRRSDKGDQYALSMKLFLLGSAHPPIRRLIAQAQPLLDEFASRTLQSIHLATPEGDHAIVIAQASGPANWEFRLRVGAALELTSTSSGKTLLAFQDDERRKELLRCSNQSPESENIDKARSMQAHLIAELEEIRKTKSRISPSGQLVGVTDISAAVLGKDGNAFAVLTCPYIQRVLNADKTGGQMDVERINIHIIGLAERLSIS